MARLFVQMQGQRVPVSDDIHMISSLDCVPSIQVSSIMIMLAWKVFRMHASTDPVVCGVSEPERRHVA